MMPNIVWLGQGACHDSTLVGGKGATLCRLAADHCVPPVFCLTTTAFSRWGRAVTDEQSTLPSALYGGLVAAYQRLAARCGVAAPSVAVRSSALDEDSPVASFAGLYNTYLNVTGAEAIARAAVGCWVSARAERVLAYRRRQGLLTDNPPIAVLVQQLIPADVSAIVFSINPVTGNHAEIVINAGWGLGESIVSGTMTPDTYRVRKADLAVLSHEAGDKRYMTVPVPGGARQVLTPRFLRTRFALNHDQIHEIARLALALEATMGWPVDVECAYQGQALHLLQCRPVTNWRPDLTK